MRINETYRLRISKPEDAKDIFELSQFAKSGLSNLPKSIDSAEKLTQKTDLSLKNEIINKEKQYLFVLENNEKKIIGVSGIKARTGVKRPYYSFLLHNNCTLPYLEFKKQHLGPSEIGSLFLSPNYRNKRIGRLLSMSRFLFIGSFPQLFSPVIIAEMRGFLYKNNVSPIWNAIGKKFIKSSFHEADLKASSDIDFIEKNFPQKPIYLNMLPKNSIKFLQQVHPLTEPAKELLISENFNITNQIDIFDGGPTLACITQNIRTIKQSKKIRLNSLTNTIGNKNYLACNHSLQNFTVMKITKQTPLDIIKDNLCVTSNDYISIVEEKNDRH